ncbi:MAG: hypothetical protein JWO94_2233 [Verrucomicrobiaceae bacterium]|nr:hypothetical protein [Verrucomicrobiaceae bacterium]
MLAVAVVVMLAALWALGCWWGGTQLACPPRRALQTYHREFLAEPAAHGVVLTNFTISDGTPCILVEPLPGVTRGARGEAVRKQLSRQQITLPPPGSVIGTLVLLHGRKGRKEDYLLIAERFCAAGYRCLLADLPGHGDHAGTQACYGMREAEFPGSLLDEAAARFHFASSPAGLMGLSMGGAVAIQAAAAHPQRWSALVVVSSFDTLENVARYQASSRLGSFFGSFWQGGVAWVFENKTGVPLASVRSIDKVPLLTMPTLIAHGTSDTVIPIKCGKRLFAALPASTEKKWIEIPGADHDNVLITDFPIYSTIAAWILSHVR